MQGKKNNIVHFSSLYFIPSTFSSFWVCLFEWAQKDLGNHGEGGGEKPQASTFFLLLLLLSRQSWFSNIRGGQEKVTVGWLVGSFTTFTHASGIRTITLSVGKEEEPWGKRKKRVVGTFSK